MDIYYAIHAYCIVIMSTIVYKIKSFKGAKKKTKIIPRYGLYKRKINDFYKAMC